jgi:autotransporter-associated beta strand protein
MKNKSAFRLVRTGSGLLALALTSLLAAHTAMAASIYWDGTGSSWSTVASWDTDPAGGVGDPAAIPGLSDTVNFSVSSITNTAQTVNLDANQAATGLNFLGFNTAATALLGGGYNRTLTLGTEGITVSGTAGAVTIGSATTGQGVAITLGGAQTWTNDSSNPLTVQNAVINGGNLLTVTGIGNTALNGVLSGSGGLTKTDAGTLTLSGRNTYTGATSITGGVLTIQDPTALGATSGVSVANGAALQLEGSFTIDRALTLNGTGISNGGALRNISGVSKYSGNITLGSATQINSDAGILRLNLGGGSFNNAGYALTVGGAGDTTLWGVVSGAGSLTMDGTGNLRLGAANTYTGTTYLNSGTVFLQAGETAGTSGPMGKSAASNPGSIVFGGGTLQFSAGNTYDYSGRFSTASQAIKIDTSSQNITFATPLMSGTGGSLSVTGLGTLTLTALSTYTGTTTVNNTSTLALNLNTAAGDNVVSSASALTLGGNLSVIGSGGTTTRSQSFNGTTFNPGNATITPTLAAASTTANVLTLDLGVLSRNAGGTSNIVLGTGNTTATNTQITTVSGSGDALVTDANSVAYLTFGTSATSIRDWAVKDTLNTKLVQAPVGFYTAATATTIAGHADIGTLSPTITGDLGDNAVASIRFDHASARTLTLDDNGGGDATFSVGGILVSSNVGNNATVIAGTGTLAGSNNGAGDLVVHNWDTSSSLRIDSVIGGSGGFTKSGSGTVILNGSNIYSGPTTISGGTLQVGTGGTTGDLGTTTGTITNNGTLVFNRSAASSTLTLSNNITGSGGLTHQGSGTTVLQGALTYRGLTTVNAGTLTIDTGSVRAWTSRGNAGGTRFIDGNGVQVNNGTLNVAGLLDVENVYITGGVINVQPGGELINRNSIGNGFYGLCVGSNEAVGASYGMLNLTGGTLTNINDLTSGQNPRFGVGIRGTAAAVLRVSDGTLNAITLLTNSAEITQLGGNIRTAGGNAPFLNTYEGNNNTGNATTVLNVAGGVFDNGMLGLNLGGGTAGSSKVIVNLNAGTLWTQATTQLNGSQALMNYNGGTLKAGAASTTFTPVAATGTSSFSQYVNAAFGSYAGGAVIDTNNFNITLPGNLLAPTGNGVSSLPVTTGGSGYVGAPMVTILDAGTTQPGTTALSNTITMANTTGVYVGQSITGTGIPLGSIVTSVTPNTSIVISQNATAAGAPTLTFKGQGATAYATISGGAVSGYVITNPGVGYVGTLSASLSGGTATGGTAATIDGTSITTAANASGGLTKNGEGTLSLSGANTFTGAIAINGGTLAFTQTVTNTYGAISGIGNVTQSGTGMTILSGIGTYSGLTTVSAGVLQLGNASALPGGIADTGGTSALTFSGGVLGLGAGNFTRNLGAAGLVTAVNFTGAGGWAAYVNDHVVNLGGASAPITWATADTGFNGQTVILGAASATHAVDLQNPIDLTTAARTIQVDNGAATIDGKLSGILSSGAGGGLTKTGLGTLEVSGINTYSGTTSINAGTLVMSGSGTLGNGAATNNLTLGGGALDLGLTSQTVGALSITTAAASGDTLKNGDLTATSYAANLASGNAIVSANLLVSGAAGFAKSGAGTVTLSGNNTYTGATSVSAGTLILSGNNSAATGGMTLTGGITQFNSPASIDGTARDVTLTSPASVVFGPAFGDANIPAALLDRIVATSTGVIGADNHGSTSFDLNTAGLTSAYLGATGYVTYTGTLTPNGTTYRLGGGGGTLIMGNTNALTGAGNSLLVNGNVTLASANDFALGTTLTSGTLALGSDTSLGAGTLTFNGGTLQSSSSTARSLANPLAFANNLTIGGSGNMAFSDTSATALGATRTFTINNSTSTFAQAFDGSGFGITKAGTGTLVLTGTNTYTGATTINGGVLRANDGVGLPAGAGGSNLNLNGGVFETGANLERVGGTGQGQMQITGGTSGFSANGAAVQVAFDSIASPTALTWGSAPFNPGTLILNASTANNALEFLNAISLANSARTIQVDANVATISGTVSSTGTSGSLTKTGLGTLVVTNANYSGNTAVTAGTLRVNAATSTLSSTTSLSLGTEGFSGGTFIYDNIGASGAKSQTFASLPIARADNAVQLIRTEAQDVSLIFTARASGGAGENGRAINYVVSGIAGTTNGTNARIVLGNQTTFRISSDMNASYFNGSDFAVYDAGPDASYATPLDGFVRAINYDGTEGKTSSGTTFTNTTHQEITGSISGQGTVALGADSSGTQNGTLKIVGASNLSMASGAVLTINSTNDTGTKGILKTGGGTSVISGGNNVNQTQKNGMIRVDGTTDVLDIAMQYNFAGSQRFMKSGEGTLIWSAGTVVPSGTFWHNAGVVEIGGNATYTMASETKINSGGLLRHNSSSTTSVISGAITGPGNLTVSAGKLTLSGGNSYYGATTVSGGVLTVSGAGTLNSTSGVNIGAGEFNYNSATALTKNVAFTGTGGTVSGSGTITPALGVTSGNAISPGNNAGTLNLGGGLTIAPGGVLVWENNTANTLGTASTNWDVVKVSGGATSISSTPGTGAQLKLMFTDAFTSFADTFWNSSRSWNFITGGVSPGTLFDTSNITVFINAVQQGVSNMISGRGAFSTAVAGNDLQLQWTPDTSGAPEIAISEGGDIASGGSKGFGSIVMGQSTSLTFTISNSGSADLNLTGTPKVAVSGDADFTVATQPSSPVSSPTGTTTFTVQFAPTITGARTATLTIANNDYDEGLFTITLTGSGTTRYDLWALGKGLTGSSGSATDPAFDADPDHDGIKNGLEWVLGGNPTQNDAPNIKPTVAVSGGSLVQTFKREETSISETALVIEYGSNLLAWPKYVTIGATTSGPDANGVVVTVNTAATPDAVSVNIPTAGNALGGKLFARMKVTRVP